MLDPHVLDVHPGGAGRVEEPGELAGQVGDDDLDDGEVARLAGPPVTRIRGGVNTLTDVRSLIP